MAAVVVAELLLGATGLFAAAAVAAKIEIQMKTTTTRGQTIAALRPLEKTAAEVRPLGTEEDNPGPAPRGVAGDGQDRRRQGVSLPQVPLAN